MTFGEYLPLILAANGFDTVFGIPGVHTVEMYRGLNSVASASSLHHITPRHEQGAGFMADGYARITRRPAACFIITGPGMTNILTAMGQAYADSIPMLVISSTLARPHLRKQQGRLHELKDQRSLTEGVTVMSHTLTDLEEFPEILAKVLRIFYRKRPSPVHIEIPLDVLTLSADHLKIEKINLPEPRLSNEALVSWDKAMELWEAAKNPLLIIGGGMLANPGQGRTLAEFLDAPTIVSINSKGILPPGHPLQVGCLLPQKPVQEAVRQADVVMAAATELGETETLLFGKDLDFNGKLIRIDIDPDQLFINASPDIAIAADIQSLPSLLKRRKNRFSKEGRERTAQLRREAWEEIPENYRQHGRILTALAQADPEVIIVGDSTQPIYGGNLSYEPTVPGAWFNSATGYGTLGYGLPAAIGAMVGSRVEHPNRDRHPVISLIGDGGMQFSLPELAAAVELKLPLPIIVWNNRGYGEIKYYMNQKNVSPVGVDIFTPDFQAIARGYGADAVKADSLDELLESVTSAWGKDRPTVIEINEEEAMRWQIRGG